MTTYVNAIGSYVPAGRVDNDRFSELTGKAPEWFLARTGIESRSRAAAGETTSSMGIAAVNDLIARNGSDALEGVDLVIGSSYTPDDTLSTMASFIEREFQIHDARVYFLSTACSSFVSALELSQLMLRAGEATKALVVVSEHNSFYSDDANVMAGHLWGDGAAAALVTNDPAGAKYRIEYVRSRGVACAGHGPDAISLRPAEGSNALTMAEGRDVFANACRYMEDEARTAVDKLGLAIADIDWMVPHQANYRILKHVAQTLELPLEKVVVTLDRFGNTGCASIPISLADADDRIGSGDLVACITFGGGYSTGVAMLRRC